MNKWKIFVIVFFTLLCGLWVIAGDVIVKNGELNITDNLLVNSNLLFVDSGEDKVGIGTVTPSEKLEVSGNVQATQFIGDGSQLTGINVSEYYAGSGIMINGSNYISLPNYCENQNIMRFSVTSGLWNCSADQDTNYWTESGDEVSYSGKLKISNSGDGINLLTLDSERPWVFRQTSSGASSTLDLHSTIGDKIFSISANDNDTTAEFFTSNTNASNKISLASSGGQVAVGRHWNEIDSSYAFDVNGRLRVHDDSTNQGNIYYDGNNYLSIRQNAIYYHMDSGWLYQVLPTDFSPYTDEGADLGTTSKKWNTVYADEFIGQHYGYARINDDGTATANEITFGEGSAETTSLNGMIWVNIYDNGFNVTRDGNYRAQATLNIACASSTLVDVDIEIDTVDQQTTQFYCPASVTPMSYVITWVGNVNAGEIVATSIDAVSAVNVNLKTGSTFEIWRIG